MKQSFSAVASDRIARACDDFMRLENWQEAFAALDGICNDVIANQASAAALQLEEGRHERLMAKVASVDSNCEKFYACKFLESTDLLHTTDLADYPWFLKDYYSAEYRFIKEHMGGVSLTDAVHVGHGAIPSLSLVIDEFEDDVAFTMIDLDADATELASRIQRQIRPRAQMKFMTENILHFQTEHTTDTAQLVLITNAPLSVLPKRHSKLACDYLFIRSSTDAGSLLYPRFELAQLDDMGFGLIERKADDLYGIHEWIIAKNISI